MIWDDLEGFPSIFGLTPRWLSSKVTILSLILGLVNETDQPMPGIDAFIDKIWLFFETI